MDGVLSPADQQNLVSSFLEIAVGQTADTARQFLQATSWKLEEAIQLFYIGNEGAVTTSSSEWSSQLQSDMPLPDSSLSGSKQELRDLNFEQGEGEDVRPPLPVRREVLYDNPMSYGASRMGGSSAEARSVVPFRNFEEEMRRPGVWGAEHGSTSNVDNSRDNLASLYRPPFALMYHGPFEKAKDAATLQNKWLLVNLQSTREFSSHMLNRDTWANDAVAQTIKTNFIFWQVFDDTEEGSKVCTYYKIDSVPVVMVLDPVTGQKMRSWRGMIQPENLLEDLLPFMDGSPTDHHVSLSHKRPRGPRTLPHQQALSPSHLLPPYLPATSTTTNENEEDEDMLRALAASMEGEKDIGEVGGQENDDTSSNQIDTCIVKKLEYPPLPEEPQVKRSLICRVGVRLPDGRRFQRNFLLSDSIQLLWSYCCDKLEEAKTRPFRLTHAIPGSSKSLDYDSGLTFQESGLANSMISVTWE